VLPSRDTVPLDPRNDYSAAHKGCPFMKTTGYQRSTPSIKPVSWLIAEGSILGKVRPIRQWP
jgi:hypothetical protein